MTLIGVIGGGQLGRMMALAGYPLGLQFRFLDPSPDCPASQVAPCVIGEYDDPTALEQFATGLDVATYEFENIPVATLDHLERHLPVYPSRNALAVSQDRLIEKQFFQQLNIPTPRFAPISTRPELDCAVEEIGLPAIVKTRRFGYDGKGQEVLRTQSDVSPAWERLEGQTCIFEQMIEFDYEVSIIAARSEDGETVFYDLARNEHRSGILRVSRCHENVGSLTLSHHARHYISSIMTKLDYIGILALELFATADGLIANEMAPRVHNSGHWTIEGTPCSQFENHVRAITGLPLGITVGPWDAGMVNLIGFVPDTSKFLAMPNVHLHLYGKQPREGRKLGHVTAVAPDAGSLEAVLKEIADMVN